MKSSFFATCSKPAQRVLRALDQISIKIKKQEVFCIPAQQPHYDISFDSSVTPYCPNFIHSSLFVFLSPLLFFKPLLGFFIYCKIKARGWVFFFKALYVAAVKKKLSAVTVVMVSKNTCKSKKDTLAVSSEFFFFFVP